MDHKKVAIEVLQAVGGKENVISVVHCMTRLRFNLKDQTIPDKEKVKQINGVSAVVESGGQFQVVIGNEVPFVYEEVNKIVGTTTNKPNEEITTIGKRSLFNRFIDMISGVFLPVIGAMAGAGILKGLLTMAVVFGWMTDQMGAYKILYAVSDAAFYFLPVLLGISAANKFKTNPYIVGVIALGLVYPSIVTLVEEGAKITFFGIPVVLINYSSSVFPIIIAAFCSAKIETWLKSKMPKSVQMVLNPLIIFVIVAPLTFLLIGPVVTYVSNLLAGITMGAYGLSPVIAGLLLGATWQILIIFGLHWGFIPIFINNFMTNGFDPINALLFAPAFAQAGAALGVALKTKQKDKKSLASTAAFTGILGITEPAIYGVTLPAKKPFVFACIAGGIGGAVAAFFGSKQYAFGGTGIFGIPGFISPEGIDKGFIAVVLSMVIGFVGAALLTYLFGYKDEDQKMSVNTQEVNKNL